MNLLKNSVLFAVFFYPLVSVHGQVNLDEKFQDLLEKSETFNQYKVITKSNLDAFWSEVLDSLRKDDQVIIDLESRNQDQLTAIDTLTQSNTDLQSELAKSLTSNNSISFLGINFTKIGYHIMVWLIIIVLATLAIFTYFMYVRSNRVTKKARKELESMQHSFKEHKDKSRDKLVKLKRELQTAVNALEETRRTTSK